MYKHIKRIHLIGIGGIGMSGIAEILLNLGYKVSGSDLKRTPLTQRLQRLGAKIQIGHTAKAIGSAQVVVISSAVQPSNPEIVAAHAQGIPVIARAEMLAELMRLKYGIAVAGTHGKTTTTSLIAAILTEARLDPTIIIGGRVRSLRSNAHLGQGEFLVAEADESDGSFLHLTPTIAVVTNIDPEHMDHYKDYSELTEAFARFCQRIPFYGAAILCADHPATARLAQRFPRRLWTYGIAKKAHIMAQNIEQRPEGIQFDVIERGKNIGRIEMRLAGRHNVSNALAAITVARELGVAFARIKRSLKNFKGIGRRMEVIHRAPLIIDDYGHHPVEIRATLEAIKQSWPQARLRVVFQPHRYTRTKALLSDFTQAFTDCHEVLVTDIYPAGEKAIVGISGRTLAEAIETPKQVRYIKDPAETVAYLWKTRKPEDLFVTLGAGDVWMIAKELAKCAKQSVHEKPSKINAKKR